MIQSLKIKNLALARNVAIDFCNGFNVLLGETGAGKSIILDALNFALGAKADKELITTGEQQMRVEAVFCDYSNAVKQELEQLGIEDEGMLIIARSLTQEGKSDIKINGNTVTLSMLKSLSKYLADSFSQHDNLILLKPKNHLILLDSLEPAELQQQKQSLQNIVEQIKQINVQIDQIGGTGENRERLIDLLQYQISEIEKEKPTVEKEQQITTKLALYNNAEKIATALGEVQNSLDGGEFGALTQIKFALRNMNSVSALSAEYLHLHDRLTSVMYELDDIVSTVRAEQRDVHFDQKEYESLDAQNDRYKMLKKKYGGSIEGVLQFLQKAQQDLDNLQNAEQLLAQLEKQKQTLTEQGNQVAMKLSEQRKQIAKKFESQIKAELAFLGMKNALFEVQFEQKQNFDENGFDNVEFLFSANAGMELKPLAKIISGGELNRFCLALKNIIKEKGACLVFDEIDSGISGEIGREVGNRIAKLSKDNQVICISHSPQVCSMADAFYLVAKQVENQKTFSTVTKLEQNQVAPALAKMASGKDLSQNSLALAQELLQRANAFKQSL